MDPGLETVSSPAGNLLFRDPSPDPNSFQFGFTQKMDASASIFFDLYAIKRNIYERYQQ